jgi:hypothetical protein
MPLIQTRRRFLTTLSLNGRVPAGARSWADLPGSPRRAKMNATRVDGLWRD